MEPDFYPHETRDIGLIQTHISWVILTGDYAYKVKKPVDFGFLDFTGLEQRKFFCERELDLNRRFSPELYLEVLPISSQGDRSFQLGTTGNIVDYCLKLAQFPQDDLLDKRLETGRFEPRWMDGLAKTVADFHTRIADISTRGKFGGVASIRTRIEANLTVAEHCSLKIRDPGLIQTIRSFCDGMLHRFGGVIEQRRQEGFVRSCHGDLHLRNIVLVNGRPHLFDCIEFNDEFRMIDVMNDVAFLVMDCDSRKRPDLGLRFISRYLERTGDYSGLRLMPLYLAYRACVRGKVACLLADDPGLDSQTKTLQMREAASYFSLAGQYAEFCTPALFVIGGLSGSGKSHLALQALSHIPAIIIRSDATRKRLATQYPDEPLYGKGMDILCYEAMFEAAETTLKAGFTVILDATFLRQADRDRARGIAKTAGAPIRIYWLDMGEKLLRERIRKRMQAGTDVSDADLEVLRSQLAAYQRPQEEDIEFLTDSSVWPGNHSTSTA